MKIFKHIAFFGFSHINMFLIPHTANLRAAHAIDVYFVLTLTNKRCVSLLLSNKQMISELNLQWCPSWCARSYGSVVVLSPRSDKATAFLHYAAGQRSSAGPLCSTFWTADWPTHFLHWRPTANRGNFQDWQTSLAHQSIRCT